MPTAAPLATAAPATEPVPHASIVALLQLRSEASFEAPALCDPLDGGRTWTWGEVVAAAVELAAYFAAHGLRRGQRLAHLGPHAPDWVVVELACQVAGLVHAPLHADAAPREHAALLAGLAPHAIAWSGPEHAAAPTSIATPVIDLRARVAGRNGPWAAGVLRSEAWRRRHADRGKLGDEIARFAEACDPDAPSVILLSSGTTGRPKGVLHSQRAVVANAAAAAGIFLDEPRDVRLSWLPMSHSLARTGDLVTALVRGGCLAVVTERTRVLEACRVAPPTVVLGVPAFFERLERAAEAGSIPDLATALGGRVRVCISGGAALRERTVAAFARHGLALVQGYGLAEAGPIVAVASPRSARPGTVGQPLAGVEVRFDDRPATRGQLLVRTPCRALGVIDFPGPGAGGLACASDEWIETGDRAVVEADGHLRITGRLVDALVLSGGAKVPAAEVEAALAEDPLVAQVCVVGQGLAAPVALVVPDPAVLRAAIRRMGLLVWSRRAALRHPRVLEWLARRLARRQCDLPRRFRIRHWVLIGRAFDAAHGEATESLKLKRDVIADHFAARIAAAAGASAAPPLPPPAVNRGSRAADCLWLGPRRGTAATAGFTLAAAAAARPPRESVAAVVEAARSTLARLRVEGRLFDAPAGPVAPRPPLADAPAAPAGKFSAAAEEALGECGLWGLLVPERFGGSGAALLELARAITRLAADSPTAAGMLAVHSAIGGVAAVADFGSPAQQERHLPGLARGRPLSIFGATEPDAGCDLHAVTARLERRDGHLVLRGTKMFITNATHGRLVKLLAVLDGRPAIVLVKLPDADTRTFRLRHYALHPLKHAHNAGLEFLDHEVDAADVLEPPAGADGMRIVWHGLNRGRVTLAAQAAGTLRLLLGQARDHARSRVTWGAPIATRELVQGRLARIATAVVACDALAAWAATAIDAGESGELEAITAKVVASECVRDAAIDALGVHGGRAFLVGHPLGDSLHDHFAVTVYEGESELLGLALFKGLCKHHPLVAAARSGQASPWGWLSWRAGLLCRRPSQGDASILDRRLRRHAATARGLLDRLALRIDRGIRRHGKGLAERQLLAGTWAEEFRQLVSVLAVAHHADATAADQDAAAADCWCRRALARARGVKPSVADHAALAALGRAVVEGWSPDT